MEHEPTFTVAAMAERLSKTGEHNDVLRLIRQLRYWTEAELLKPVSEKRSGTGNPREYDQHELLKAAVAVAITDNLRVRAPALTDLMSFIDTLRGRDEGWQYAMRREGPMYMAVTLNRDRVQVAEFQGDKLEPPAFDNMVWLTLNLTEVARRVLP